MTDGADIVIVGAGAAGLAFGWRIARPGLRVVCLERGARVDQRASPTLTDDWELALQTRYNADPNLRAGAADYPVDDSQSPIRPAIFNAVGGSTIRWGAHFPRFHPSDFRAQARGHGVDWPLRYADLAPYYDINDRMMGVSGLAGDPANPPRAPRPCPPLPLCPATERLARGFDRLGWHWWPSDAAIRSTPSGDREGCNNCGPCGLGCPRHARASADIAYLPAATARGLRLIEYATVTGVDLAGGCVTSVRYTDARGTPRRIACAEAVLAGNALGTARLMQSHPDLADHPVLGTGLMLHPTAIVTGVFDDDLQSHRGAFAASLASQQFCENDPARGFVGGFQMQALREQGPLVTALGGYGTRLPWGSGHAAAFRARFGRTISLTVTCDDPPEPENRIALHARRRAADGLPVPRMIYRVGDNSRRMLAFGIDRASEALRASGARAVDVTPLSRGAGFHLMGTARMGHDPNCAVTDDCGRVHGIDGLTIVDASVFVSAASVNPTPTLQAIALRAADAMAARLRLAPAEPAP